jgi:hypothetical protein
MGFSLPDFDFLSLGIADRLPFATLRTAGARASQLQCRQHELSRRTTQIDLSCLFPAQLQRDPGAPGGGQPVRGQDSAQMCVTVPPLVSGQVKLRADQLTEAPPATFCTIVMLPFGARSVATAWPSTACPMVIEP